MLERKLAWRLRHVYRLEEMPKSYIKVLLHIATEGPKTKYQIEKETDLSHATVHEAVKVLLAYRQVEGRRIGTTRVGLAKIEYSLTPRGLIEALEAVAREGGDIEKIVQKWKHVEPVFIGKWDYLVEKIGREKVEEILLGAASFLDWITAGSNVETFREETVRRLFGRLWYEPFLDDGTSLLEKQEVENWVEAFRGDPQLKLYVEKYIAERLEYLQKEMEWILFLKRKFFE